MNKKLNSSLSLRKLFLSALVAAPLATLPSQLWALPSSQANLNAQVNATSTGTTVTLTAPDTVTVNTTTNASWVKWNNFGDALLVGGGANGAAAMTIGSGENVTFTQQAGSGAAVLNLVLGANPTTIAGNINSNGQVYIVNPNGISFTGASTVNTAGLTLSTRPNESEVLFAATGQLSSTSNPTANGSIAIVGGGTAAAPAISVGTTGNIVLIGSQIDVSGNINAGTLTLNSIGNYAANLGTSAATSIGLAGNTTVPGNGAVVINDSTGTVNVANGNAVTINGGKLTVNAAGTGATVNQGAGALTVGDTVNAGTITVNAGTNTVHLDGAAGINGNGQQVNVGLTSGDAFVTGTNSVGLNASTVAGNLTVTVGTAGNIASNGTVAMTGTNKTISLTDNVGGSSGASVTFKGSGNLTFSTLSANGSTKSSISVTSVDGSVTLPTVALNAGGGGLSVTAQTNIAQTAATTITNAKTSTFDAVTGSITLGTTGTPVANTFGTVVLKDAPAGATVTATGVATAANNQFPNNPADGGGTYIIVGSGTNLSGNATVYANAGGIQLGGVAGSGDTIKVSGNLSLDTSAAGGRIDQFSDNTTVLGSLNLKAGTGIISLAGSAGNAIGLKNQYGQVNITSGANATLAEQTTLNLGSITLTGNLVGYSLSSIVNSGQLIIGGTTQVGAGSATAPGDIALNYTAAVGSGNQLGGKITLLDDLHLLSPTSTVTGNYLAKSLTIVNENNTTVAVPANVYGTGMTGDITISTPKAGSTIVNASNGGGSVAADAIITTGKLNLTTTSGAITLNNSFNSFTGTNVTTTAGGSIVINSAASALTVNAAVATGSTVGATASYTSGGSLTIGSYTSDYSGTTSFNSGSKGAISDSAPGILIFGNATFNSSGNVSITKSGHNFGGISITTGSNGNATLVESGTLNLASASISGTGNLSLTSTNGDILRSSAGTVALGNSKSTSQLTANNGRILIDNTYATTGANNFNGSKVGATASGNISFLQTGADMNLGNIVTGGTLTINTGISGKKITETSGSTINAYGAVTLTTQAGAIDLSQTGNQFGAFVVDTTNAGGATGGANVSIKEATTLNLQSIATGTGGNLTATSENGSVIDSVNSTLGSNKVVVGGTTAFSAAKGNITLTLSGSDYNIVGFTTGGNATLTDGVGGTTLTSTNVTGNLTVFNSAGNIGQDSNAVTVTGQAYFNASAGTVTLGSANQFGTLKFFVGNGVSTINQSGSMTLVAGTTALGQVSLITGGNFTTTGSGTSQFLSSTAQGLTIVAVGNITPTSHALFVKNGLTVSAAGTKDLSQLSLLNDLNNVAPTYSGTGADGSTNAALAPTNP